MFSNICSVFLWIKNIFTSVILAIKFSEEIYQHSYSSKKYSKIVL